MNPIPFILAAGAGAAVLLLYAWDLLANLFPRLTPDSRIKLAVGLALIVTGCVFGAMAALAHVRGWP